MGAMASQITGVSIVYSTVYSGVDQRNTKAPRHWPLWGEFTGDLWIALTKGQWREKCFLFMTSSWTCTLIFCQPISVLIVYIMWGFFSDCGGSFNGPVGNLTSPGFPGPYPSNAYCIYHVNRNTNFTTYLSFVYFGLEGHSSCHWDYLEVGVGNQGPILFNSLRPSDAYIRR